VTPATLQRLLAPAATGRRAATPVTFAHGCSPEHPSRRHPRILVIGAARETVAPLGRALASYDVGLVSVADVLRACRLATRAYDLLILDLEGVQEPCLDAVTALARYQPAVPIILLATDARLDERVAGLDAGASDYVVKPFAVAEFAARVRAQLRTAVDRARTVLAAGDLELELITRRALRAGQATALTPTEFALLSQFMRRPGELLTREQLLRAVWGSDVHVASNVLEVYISYLRRKLRRDGQADPIVTVRSVGYRLRTSPVHSADSLGRM